MSFFIKLLQAIAQIFRNRPAPRPDPPKSEPVPPTPDPVEPSPITWPSRPGVAAVNNRAFEDSAGQWNPLGATLFWAIWGEINDPDRLDANLKYLAENKVDFVRILTMVGSPSWSDRVINPKTPGYWDATNRLFERLAKYGIRAAPTIFADADDMMPNWHERRSHVHQWGAFMASRREQVLYAEVVNEHWQNGFREIEDVREYGEILIQYIGTSVALSSPADEKVCAMYHNWGGIATLHYDRGGDPHRYIRQVWGYPGEYREKEHYNGPLPSLVSNSEPKGPHSSGEEDSNPRRLSLAYVTTFVAGNGAYVYHCGAGIRGGGQSDQDRGRFPNIYDYPHEILRAMRNMKELMPVGLANWNRSNAQWDDFPWALAKEAVEAGIIMREFTTYRDGKWFGVTLGVKGPHNIRPRHNLYICVRDPLDGRVIVEGPIEKDRDWLFPGELEGYVWEAYAR